MCSYVNIDLLRGGFLFAELSQKVSNSLSGSMDWVPSETVEFKTGAPYGAAIIGSNYSIRIACTPDTSMGEDQSPHFDIIARTFSRFF